VISPGDAIWRGENRGAHRVEWITDQNKDAVAKGHRVKGSIIQEWLGMLLPTDAIYGGERNAIEWEVGSAPD
jgi:hypothetical protein